MAIQIYSDDSDEVMGATLKSKAVRRHLDRAGELLGVTGGPDDGLAACIAKMPTAGTISDGSVNPNPTTPVNSVSLEFGFFLRASRSDSSPEVGTRIGTQLAGMG